MPNHRPQPPHSLARDLLPPSAAPLPVLWPHAPPLSPSRAQPRRCPPSSPPASRLNTSRRLASQTQPYHPHRLQPRLSRHVQLRPSRH
eukprot:1547390-Prymnesium_polylepis.2